MLYVLSYLGAHLAFMPLLVLLLPRRVLAVAPDHTLTALSWLLLLGGVVASLAHIGAGAIGDFWFSRHGSRRAVICAGLLGLIASYGLLGLASTLPVLAAAMICFQLTFNLLFAPLGALMTDYVPNDRKGRVAGWLNAGLPLSTLMVTALARLDPDDGVGGFLSIAAIISGLTLPLLIVWPFKLPSTARGYEDAVVNAPASQFDRHDLLLAAFARLLMQFGASLLVNYLFIYLTSLDASSQASGRIAGLPTATSAVGILTFCASVIAMVGAIAAGHRSDAQRQRRRPMMIAASISVLALILIANPTSWLMLVTAYVLFQASLSAYLAGDCALVAQLLGNHTRRGTYLGLMNLTNTLPAIIAPMLAIATSASASDALALSRMITACALAAGAAAILIGRVRTVS